MIKCTFSDVSERDMDLLFLEEFVCSEDFLNLFLSKINLVGASVCEIEQSKTDVELGESDMTIIVEKDNKKYGILIEDKINAKAMQNQSGRYINRGEKGKQRGDYEAFFVFIVAPKEYLTENIEAKKYANYVTYEECLDYFQSKNDNRSAFKAQQIYQAIHKQKQGYQVIENTAVTQFWREYIRYQKEHYPKLNLRGNDEPKGSNANWVAFHTNNAKIKIYHKSSKGYVDLEFSGLGDKSDKLKELIKSVYGNPWENGLEVHKTGKSAVIRITVQEINFKSKFSDYEDKVNEALEAVNQLYLILDEIPIDKLNALLNN